MNIERMKSMLEELIQNAWIAGSVGEPCPKLHTDKLIDEILKLTP